MDQIGMPLDDWQAAIVVDMFGLDDENLWAAFEVCVLLARQNGKGACTEARELFGLFVLKESLILHSAHLFKTSANAFRRVVGLIDGTDWLSRQVQRINRGKGEEAVELTRHAGGGQLQFVARTLGSGRGLTGDCNVFDEAAWLTVGQYAAQTPTLATVPNPQIIYTSTPPDEDVGPMPEDAMLPSVRKRGMAGDPRMAYYEWSPPEGFDRTDPRVWRASNPSMSVGRITERFLGQQLKAFSAQGSPEKFDTEHLGVWPPDPDSGWVEIPEQAWKDALDAESGIVGSVAFAVAVSADRAWTTVSAAGRRVDGLRHVETVTRRLGTSWLVPWLTEVDYEAEAPDGKNRLDRWKPCAIVLDPGGPSGSLVADLEAAGVDLVAATSRQWGQASAAFFDGIAGKVGPGEEPRVVRDVRHRGQEDLTAAAKAAAKRKLGESWAWERYGDVDASPLEGATLALWGHATHAHLGITEIDGNLMAGED